MNVDHRRGKRAEIAAGSGPVYLDCNATTPLERRVRDVVVRYLDEDYGNAGSRTHEYGSRARKAVEEARGNVARVVGAKPDEVVFTSGATEANNLAILGLAAYGEKTAKRHIISTQLEHKAVLEPIEMLRQRGFTVDLVPPTKGGWVEPGAVAALVRADTLLVSVMHANNETGIIQPLREICGALDGNEAFLHVDAAQGFGKELEGLREQRVDLISVSAHKIYGPKGVGALVMRRRGFERPPLMALVVGGGQERGLRPGTLPVPLVAGLGEASRLALAECSLRRRRCEEIRDEALRELIPLSPVIHGDDNVRLPHVLNLSFDGVDSEALMLALKRYVAISNGAACTSHSYETSHVLMAMGLSAQDIAGTVRLSWSHLTPSPDWNGIATTIRQLRA